MDISQAWFTSDTHFSHRNILTLGAGRPFRDITHHDESLIANWNSVVSPGDTVFHLGDVALGSIDTSLELVRRMNGTIYLVPGNHDRVSSVMSASRRERFLPVYEDIFDGVLDEIVEATLGGYQVLLSHYPYTGDSQERDRHADMRPVNTGLPLIHGHTHHNNTAHDGLQFHVGVDAHNYTPVHASVIAQWLETVPS